MPWSFYISGVWEFQPNLQCCHPEWSEGSLYLTSSSTANELEMLSGDYAERNAGILRFAQNDRLAAQM